MQDAASLFARSLIVGVSIAAPVGPIGLLVIQRTLQHGRAIGLATGLGAAVADAVYGAVGAFGVTGLIAALATARVPLALAGGAFLLWLAWQTWHSAPAPPPAAAAPAVVPAAQPGGGRRQLLSAFTGSIALTLANPATIVSFVAVFGALAAQGAPASPLPMVGGVLLGSASWWLLLCAVVGRLRQRFDQRLRRSVNRCSALLLALLALAQWWALAAG